jgi:hypothetical protein
MTIESGNLGGGYCFGSSQCPCSNIGGAGEGCANSSGAGAILTETGSTSVGADDLGFAGAGLLPSQPALLFVGDTALGGGDGAASWGPGLGAAGGWTAGDTRYFQLWYRDSIGSPCGIGFNLTNGVALTFGS